MSWNVLLEHTTPRPFTGRSQAAKPTLCLRWPPAAKSTPKMLRSWLLLVYPAPIPCIQLAAIEKTRAPQTDADAVSLKSP